MSTQPTRGYYSLIQYCPDASRLEAVNIGVVLLCPEIRFLGVRLSEGNGRVRRFFGAKTFDAEYLGDAKRALETRFEVERDRFQTLGDLTHFAETRANGLTLSLPRPIKITNPAQELVELFATLVEETPKKPRPRSSLGRKLVTLFKRPELRDKILRDQKIMLPVIKTSLSAPYAYQNGKLNLIITLTGSEQTIALAQRLALEGDLLRRHDAPAQLQFALANPTDLPSKDQIETAEKLLSDYDLPFYREDDLEELATKIAREAH